jgi:NFU1 iron-sulfur cluster scaffold homolog, mitochondrial
MSVTVTVEPMRNEHSVSFLLDKTLIPPGTGSSYPNREKAQSNPLAKALFEIQGVNSVWILGNEVQVTKDYETTWGALKGRVVETIRQNA